MEVLDGGDDSAPGLHRVGHRAPPGLPVADRASGGVEDASDIARARGDCAHRDPGAQVAPRDPVGPLPGTGYRLAVLHPAIGRLVGRVPEQRVVTTQIGCAAWAGRT